MNDVFFLAYGGLHWSYFDILALPVRVRKRFVEMLDAQIELEKEELGKARRLIYGRISKWFRSGFR
jgi:hypothetical protein